MAKWGEGDPRWIVEDRPDATNVNNWHWVEKKATEWSKGKFQDLFVGLKVEDDRGSCEITELTKTEGEATVNNRKGKIIFFYEWVLEGTWKGILSDGQKKVMGKFEIPNLSEENSADEIDITVTIDKETDEAHGVKEIMRSRGLQIVREQVAKYIKDLKEEYSKDLILPSKDNKQSNGVKSKPSQNTAKQELNKVVQGTSDAQNDVGVRIHTSNLQLTDHFKCNAIDLYRALTEQQMVQAYAGSDSTIAATPGERFMLMGGNITGDFTQLVPGSKVYMRWRMKSWPEEHYSNVTIDLEEKDGETFLTLKQTGVPQGQVERTKEGWKMNFFERMKQVFGFGAKIY